jgi:hypothetical protein
VSSEQRQPGAREQRASGGVNLKTLLIAAASSAVAATIVPLIWEPGTVFAAAMTPVIVAIMTEVLKRPVETVSAVTVRRTPGGAAILEPPPPPQDEETFDPLAPPPTEELEALPEEQTAPRAEHRRRPLTARQWKLALATGLLAFAAVVVFFTVSELVTGKEVTGGGARTTFFGGSRSESKRDKQDSDKDKKKSEEEASPTATPSATETPAESATPTTTASPTQTPAQSAQPNAAPPAESPGAAAPSPAP